MLLQVKLGIKCPAPRIGHNISFNDTVTLHIFERSHITEFIFGWQGSVTDALHFTVPSVYPNGFQHHVVISDSELNNTIFGIPTFIADGAAELNFKRWCRRLLCLLLLRGIRFISLLATNAINAILKEAPGNLNGTRFA